MRTSTKVFSTSTTLLTLVAMVMPLVALASTSSPIGTAPVTTPTPINGDITMKTTDTAHFTPGVLTIDGATNYIFPSTAIQTGGETLLTVAAKTHRQTLQKQKIHLLLVLSQLLVYKSQITAVQTLAGHSMLIQRTFTMAHMI